MSLPRAVALKKANMKLVWCWLLTLNSALYCVEGTCFMPEVYTIGIVKVSHLTRYPTWTARWCDAVMLCGRAPLSLRITTMETAINKTFESIEQQPKMHLWLLTASINIDPSSVLLIKKYFQSQDLQMLDYFERKLPETDADWCSLILTFAYTKSGDHAPDYPHLHVDYILSVVREAQLNTVVVVYDNTTDMELIRLSDGLSSNGVLHILHNAELAVGQRVDSVYGSYWDLGSRQVVDFEDYTNILLWCDGSCVSSFLSKMAMDAENWGKIVTIQHMTRLLIVSSSVASKTYSSASQQLHDVVGNRTLNFAASDGNFSIITQEIENILNMVQHLFHVAVLWKAEDCVRLQTLLVTSNGSRTLSYAGFGDNRGHIAMTSELFPNTKWRLNRQKFIVATAIWEPFVMVKETNGKQEYSGLCIDMLKALSLSLNFTYELRMPPDGQYGSIENGSWTGLVRMLKDKEAQLVVAPIAVNDLRATVVDFTTPFYHDYTAVLFRRPDPALHKWKTYFMPFSWQVLMFIAVSFVVATTFGHVVGVLSVDLLHQQQPASGVMDTVQYFFGSLLAQGGVWNPTTGSARMFVSAWWLFCVIIAAIYSGNLTASFAVTLYDPSFATLQAMLDEGAYDFGTVPGTIWFDIFKYSNRSEFKRIEKKMKEFSREHAGEKINETSDHVKRTLRENYAYISNMASLTLTIDNNCDLMILDETFLPLQYAIALQKGSPLTDTVSRWILQMNEGGLDLLWASHWWQDAGQKCGASVRTAVKTVTLKDCQSAFYLLLLGFVMALLAILSESLFHWFCRRRWDGLNERARRTAEGRQGVSVSPSKATANVQNGVSTVYMTNDAQGDGFTPVSDFNGLQTSFIHHEPTCNGNSTPPTT